MSARKALLFAAIAAMAGSARASTVYYTGEAAFNAALGTLTQTSTGSFSSYNGFSGTSLTNANGTGVNFLGFNGAAPDNLTVSANRLLTTLGGDKIEIDFPSIGPGVYAIGFHITTTSAFAFWCVAPITSSGCDNSIVNSSSSDTEFFGIISTAPLSTALVIRPQSGSPILVVPDFRTYADESVPEPATLALTGLGLAILPLVRRRYRKGAGQSG